MSERTVFVLLGEVFEPFQKLKFRVAAKVTLVTTLVWILGGQ